MTRPTEDHVMRKVRDIRRGDQVWIDGEWRTVEAGGSWPESPNVVELTTEPHSEGFTFNPSVSLPVIPDPNPAKAALHHHTSGAVERGEAEPITAVEGTMQADDVKAVAAGLRNGAANHYVCQAVAHQILTRAKDGPDLSEFYAECLPESSRNEYLERRAAGETPDAASWTVHQRLETGTSEEPA